MFVEISVRVAPGKTNGGDPLRGGLDNANPLIIGDGQRRRSVFRRHHKSDDPSSRALHALRDGRCHGDFLRRGLRDGRSHFDFVARLIIAKNIIRKNAKPFIDGGLALALMEAAADYGVADYFGTPTLSVGIFRTWYGRGDLTAATQLALGLFLVALLFYIIEDLSRRGQFAENAKTARGHGAIQLRGWHEIIAICVCATPVILGFVIPVAVLIGNAMTAQHNQAIARLAPALGNTAFVALCGAAIAAILALGLAYGRRILNSRIMKSALRIATLGYAIPGAVIAIGLLALLNSSSILSGVTLISGVSVLIYAYVARFLTASFSITEAGLSQINRQVDSAAQTLGAGPMRIVREIHIPVMRRAILAGAAIVAIDIAKELPATLLLRPFNFETLSTQVYRLASDERLIEASPAALVLIFFGLAPVLALGRAETSRSIGL